ncbi:MAG: helix-turn-helix transcriptional regulator [Atribacterota bacterium]|nr:helix-turn-helix transcriptional regulator [Atribacterota bacterium]
MKIDKGIYHICAARDMTYKELAQKTGLTATFLSMIGSGDVKPTLKTIDKIAKALHVPVPLLFWFSMDEKDEGNPALIKIFKQTVDELISKMYL